MMIFQYAGPLLAAVLYVIVFQKAGFRGPILAVCAGPLVGFVATMFLIRILAPSPGTMMLIPLISIPLSLLPLILLAFMAWPPVAAPRNSTEK